jgi:hypothetical protein
VLNVVRALAREEFTLAEVYARGEERGDIIED